jgi:cell division protein FtsL
MLRVLVMAGLMISLLSAFALYSTSTETRQLAEAVADKQITKEELIRSIAILKAEQAYRTRPEVIEPLARRLGMRPVRGEQYVDRRTLISSAGSQ